MKSSYAENNFDLVFKSLSFSLNPKKVIEVGVLEGFSLRCILENVSEKCDVYAYDLFEDFPYNAAVKEEVQERFKEYNNLQLVKKDYKLIPDLHDDETIDIIHVDIANTEETFKYCVENYLRKLKKDRIMILEGGSKDRDEVYWMKDFNKPKINPYLKSIENDYNFVILEKYPSITIFRK